MPATLRVERVYKVFGPSSDEAIKLVEEGVSKDDVLQQTGNVVAVNNVTFSVQKGEVFVVMGLSGSGKSTLVRLINRLIQPTSGHIYVEEEDVLAADEERLREIRRSKMAMVFQHFALFPHRRVVENVEYGLKVRGVESEERRELATRALQQVGLEAWADYYPDNLSGGMRQRVGLARALATDAEILLMDEAFSALDPLIRREMQDDLIRLQHEVHKTIIFISHDLGEALKMGDRIAIMKDGEIVQIGTPEEIVSGPADEYVADFTRDVDRGRVVTAGSIMQGAEALVVGRDSVRTALFRMRELSRDALYVVDNDNRPTGLVVDQEIARAVREGVHDLAKVLTREFPQTPSSSTLADIYTLCAEGLPVAVVGEDARLLGVVNQFDVLVNLAAESEPRSSDAESPPNQRTSAEPAAGVVSP